MDALANQGQLTPEQLEATLVAAQRRLSDLGELDGTRVENQVAKAAEQQKIWETRQLIAELAADEARKDGQMKVSLAMAKEARYCSGQAHKWSEQQTRALKQSHADRLADLEKELEQRGARRAKLKAVQ